MSAANDPNANPPYPERDDAPEAGQPDPSPTTGEGGTPPRPAPKVRIQRGATVYAPWRRGDAPPAPTAPPQPAGDAPQTPASPPPLINYVTPAVAPTVVIRPAPGSQNWTATDAGSEPTIEMTIEFAAVAEEEMAQSAPPQFTVIRADNLLAPPPARTATVFAEASPILVETPPAPIAAEPAPIEAWEASSVTDALEAEAAEFVAPEPDAPAVAVPMEAATPIAPSAELAAEKTPAPARTEIEEAEVEATAFVPAETALPPEVPATAVTEPAAPLTPPVLAEATPPALRTTRELGPELSAPSVAETEMATPPPAEFAPVEAMPEPVAAEPIAEIPPLPELDPIPLVPEISLLAETLPLTAAFRQTILLIEPLSLPEPPVPAPYLAEELPAPEAVSESLETEVEAVPLVTTPPVSVDAEPNLAPVEPSRVDGLEDAEEPSVVPLLSPDVETFPQAFAPPAVEAVEAASSPQEALTEETFPEEAFAHELAPVAEAVNAPVPIPITESEDAPAPVVSEAESLGPDEEMTTSELLARLEAATGAPQSALPTVAVTGTPTLLATTEERALAVSADSAGDAITVPPDAHADAEPFPPSERTEPSPIVPAPPEIEPVAATAGIQEEQGTGNREQGTGENAQYPIPNTQRLSAPTPDPQPPAPAVASFAAPLDIAPVAPTTRRTPRTPAPPVAQAPPETVAKPRGLLRPNRAARPAAPEPSSEPDTDKMNGVAPTPVIPGHRLTLHEIAETERIAREEEWRQKAVEGERFRRTPPLSSALPGAARFFAVVGLVCAALGLLARPLADAAKGAAPLAVAQFANALEGDSRMQWRNLRRRPEGAAISASRRTEARVVVILAEQRRGASRDERPMGRVELARLMRLCHDAGVPVIGVAADTASLPRTTAIAVGGPQRTVKQGPDPLAAAIRDIQQAGKDVRPTFTVLPAVFASVVQGRATAGGATLRANTDPLLSSKGIVRGFIGPSPVAADFGEGAQKRTPLRRSLTLSARVAPPPGGTAAAISLPAALAYLTLPDAALWPQVGGTETKASDVTHRLSAVFAYPDTPSSQGKPGEKPVAIDFGLLQSDPEGVQVVSADYVRSLTVAERRALLESRPVVIGLDRPADWIQTPLSSPRFIVLPPVKPMMAAAEAEGRAAAMLLARAERNSQLGNRSAATLPPPAPYMEPVPPDYRGWAALLPAALLGYLLSFAGRRLAAPAVKAPKQPEQELTQKRSSARFWGDAVPLVLGIALAAAIGWAWRVYGTPGFASYIEFPGFAPWAAPWAASLLTAGVFFLALIGMWMVGPAWGGKGVALIVAFSAFAFGALVIQDFALFPAWTPLLAPLGGFLLGSAFGLGSREKGTGNR